MKFGENKQTKAAQASDKQKAVTALLCSSIDELHRRGLDVAHLPQEGRHQLGMSELTWRQAALAIDHAEVAEQAYLAVCQQVDIDHYICRVYLDDLAELLVLAPLVYRRIRREARNEASSQIAA
jgi:hypothetical protein